MPTRRIFELIIVVDVLLWPARSTVKTWGRKQLAIRPPGTVMHAVGQAVVTIA